MKTFGTHNYYVYITTNLNKTVLYVGVTNDIERRLFEHERDSTGDKKHFAGKYKCVYLIHLERFTEIEQAIAREKQVKSWTRARKNALISETNSEWMFLNDNIMPTRDPSLRSG